jgi:hypothetical protein
MEETNCGLKRLTNLLLYAKARGQVNNVRTNMHVPKATMMARLMSVIMPGLWSASSPHAPRMKTRPP